MQGYSEQAATVSTSVAAQDFVPANGTYLLSHSVGRPLVNMQPHLQEKFFTPWENAAGDPWGSWMGELAHFQSALANLLGGAAEQFCPQSNLSSALCKILFAVAKRPGKQKILLSECDFPSMGFVLEKACALGYELKFLPATLDQTDAQVWLDAMQGDVQWVLITQVQSNTGVQVPVQEIAAGAREREVFSIVDCAQGVGILPIDVLTWSASFVLGSCVKWLCGGPGAGFMWVHPALLEQCVPLDVGWFSHANPFEFDIHHFAYHPTALRFWGGTPSVQPFIVAAHSIAYFSAYGMDAVRQHNLALTQRLIDASEPSWLVSPARPESRSGTVVLHFGDKQQQVAQALQAKHIRFDLRPLGMRISPHIYNNASDMDAVLCTARQFF